MTLKDDLAELAVNIGNEGAANDGLMVLLVKGMTDAQDKLANLAQQAIDMAKGKGKPPPDDDGGGSDDDDDTDEGSEGAGEGDGKPGYQDMAMAVANGAVTTVAPNGEQTTTLDMTTWILETGASLVALQKGAADQTAQIAKLVEQNERLLTQNAQLAGMIQATAEVNTALMVPLAKAVVETRNGLLRTAAPGITPREFPRTPVAVLPDTQVIERLGGSERAEQQILAKAMSTGSIDISSKELFRRQRKFSMDDARDAELRAKVNAIVPEFTTAR